MERFNPIFGYKNDPEKFSVTASASRNYSPPISPMSKKPMLPSYAMVDGRRINMYVDMDNRLAYHANKEDVI